MYHKVLKGETIPIIARNYRLPIAQLLSANPTISWRLVPGQLILIPSIPAPETIPFQIRISKSKKTLTLLKNNVVIKTYPVAIGKMVTETPTGSFVVVNREQNPGGPYGMMWLSLSKAGYGIHGTNNPASIGKSVSKGCIRMYNNDVLELAKIIPNGTRVLIQP